MEFPALFFVQDPDGIQYAEDRHSCIGEHGEPHGGDSHESQYHDECLYCECEHNVLVGDRAGALCDPDRGRDRIHTGSHKYDISSFDRGIRTTAHRSSDIGACENRCVIDPIADEHRAAALGAEFLQDFQFVGREKLCINMVDPDSIRNSFGSGFPVTGEHCGADPHGF